LIICKITDYVGFWFWALKGRDLWWP